MRRPQDKYAGKRERSLEKDSLRVGGGGGGGGVAVKRVVGRKSGGSFARLLE